MRRLNTVAVHSDKSKLAGGMVSATVLTLIVFPENGYIESA